MGYCTASAKRSILKRTVIDTVNKRKKKHLNGNIRGTNAILLKILSSVEKTAQQVRLSESDLVYIFS